VFVIDNSVVVARCFEDETSPYTEGVLDRLGGTQALVPAIWPLDVANVLLIVERRDRLSEAQTAHFAQLLEVLPILVEEAEVARTLGPVLAVWRAHRLSAYDAADLELAARQGLPLATQDRRLRRQLATQESLFWSN
jgi:predicted nucleic acid-binding protein